MNSLQGDADHAHRAFLTARYAGEAQAYARLWAPVIGRASRRLLEALPLEHARCVVDIGAGTGFLLRDLQATAPAAFVVGVDLSWEMLRHALASQTMPVAVMDPRQLALRDACADAVVAAFMLFHVPEPVWALAEARRVRSRWPTIGTPSSLSPTSPSTAPGGAWKGCVRASCRGVGMVAYGNNREHHQQEQRHQRKSAQQPSAHTRSQPRPHPSLVLGRRDHSTEIKRVVADLDLAVSVAAGGAFDDGMPLSPASPKLPVSGLQQRDLLTMGDTWAVAAPTRLSRRRRCCRQRPRHSREVGVATPTGGWSGTGHGCRRVSAGGVAHAL